MADYYLHKTAAHIDELLEKVEGLDNYDDTEVRGLINNKVDKVTGKGLSTNDFTDAYKTDLDGLDTELNGKVDKETGKGLSTNDFTTEEKTKLAGIESGAQANVQSDWNQTNTESKDFIKNKPTIPAAQVNADWDAVSGVAQILNKPTIPDAQIQSDWNQNDTESKDFIKNKPTLGTASAKDYTTAVSGLSTDLITSAGVSEALSDKVDKVTGKGLSTNDFTNSYKETLDGLSSTLNLKADLVDGKVPAAQLPSYVDDVVEYASASLFPATGESGKIYVATDTNKTYRWGGSEYTEISESLALGETASTAYPGNKGKANADAIGTIANLTTTATNLVDAVNELNSGKVDKNGTDSLMTAAEHTKLSGIESGAEVNVQSDWNQTDTTADDYIKNKPNIPSGVVVDTTYDGTSENAQAGTAVAQAISTKVDKVTGKGLSENDYTNADKAKLDGIEAGAEVNVQADWSQTDSTADDYIKNKPTITTVNDATLTIQKNGTTVGTFSANAATAATINITVPVDADDVSALPDTTKYGASLALSIDSSTYVVTATLKDQDGNTLGTAQTIDLPLETVVVGGSYDDTTKKVVLTLKNGNTIDFSVADLVAGLQTEITSTNKLDADLVDDTTSVHKFVTAADKTAWNAKSDFSGDYDDLTNKPTIPTVDQTYDPTSANAQSGVAIEGKKPGLKTTGTQYTISGRTVVAGDGAETFNDYTNNQASGQYSHAEGRHTTASGSYSHAEGCFTIASGSYSHAEGSDTVAGGYYSHAEGYGTIASFDNQHVQGRYNVADPAGAYAFIIGNGTSNNARHNAFAIDWNGLIYVNGAATGVNVSQCITPTDYATQTTGGTIKAWTTTDGSDTILHLATQ